MNNKQLTPRTILDFGKPLMKLSGPWWTNDKETHPEAEHSPEEAFFRAEFAGVGEALFQVAAQNFYQCWLNGHWLGYGPVRAPHGRLTVDEWAIPAGLCQEHNTLSIQVFWEGIFVFDHVRGTPGLWMALEREGAEVPVELLVTTRTGRVVTHRSSHQRGWAEEIDGRECAAGWPWGPWNASEWSKPALRKSDPAVVLEARDIAPYATQVRRPQSVSFAGACDLANGTRHRPFHYESKPLYGEPEDSPSHQLQAEILLPSGAVDRNLSALTASGEGFTVLGIDPDGRDRTVQWDFAQETAGLLELELEAPAGTVVDIGWSEGLWQEALMGCWARSPHPDGAAAPREFCDARQAVRYVCSGSGVERFASLYIAAFRHLRIAFRCPHGQSEEIKLHRLQARTIGYPLKREGTFACGDEALNRIYQAALSTMECSISDVFMDCPGRERGAYLNDSFWTAAGFQAVTSDVALEQRFLRQFIEAQTEMPYEEFLLTLYPSEFGRWLGGPQKPWIGHSLFWLIQVERYLRLFGDAAMRQEWKPAVVKLIDVLGRSRSVEGVLDDPNLETFWDWSRYKTGPIQTGNNFVYAHALLLMGRLYNEPEWTKLGRQTAAAIERAAWTGNELYSDTVVRDPDNKLCPGPGLSETMNAVALWTDLVPQERAERVWRQLRNFHPRSLDRSLFDYETNLTRSNVYGLLYRFEHQGRIGDISGLVQDLKEAYLPMFDRGQTCLSEHLGYVSSLCHGLNGYVAHLLPRYVAGIELPEYPGGEIVIRPQPAHLPWCQARVPWMGGYVQVWWNRTAKGGCRTMASLPPGQTGKLTDPSTGKMIPFTTSITV
ncbi:MAG: family 78 glycoside hydrolase catalytic domain [Terrimicrobiaceae bacterium]